jgi:hypothetical protein
LFRKEDRAFVHGGIDYRCNISLGPFLDLTKDGIGRRVMDMVYGIGLIRLSTCFFSVHDKASDHFEGGEWYTSPVALALGVVPSPPWASWLRAIWYWPFITIQSAG